MLKNYLKITFRVLVRNKLYSFINVIGLTLGSACCLIVFLFIRNELSYDQFHANKHRIYRATTRTNFEKGMESHAAWTRAWVGEVLKEFPEVEATARLLPASNIWASHAKKIQCGEKEFFEDRIFFADPAVLKIFSISLRTGSKANVLTDPNSILVSESMAHKYFGNEDPVGKILIYEKDTQFQIGGVFHDIPQNSHIKFDFLAPLESLDYDSQTPHHYTYILLHENTNINDFESKIAPLAAIHEKIYSYQNGVVKPISYKELGKKAELLLQPLASIHLHSNLDREAEVNSDWRYLYIYSIAAVLALLVACFNFMNLATALAHERAREVGIRKTLGSTRKQLALQFFCESMVFSSVALILAASLTELALPFVNQFTQRSLVIHYLDDFDVLAGFIIITVIAGLLAGSYPAMFISAFSPQRILKGITQTGGSRSFLRKSLVVVQFSVAVFALVGIYIVQHQLDFIQNKRLGFDKENVVIIQNKDSVLKNQFSGFKTSILQNPQIISASYGDSPGQHYKNGFEINGKVDAILNYGGDYDYLKTLKLELVKGRNFSKEFGTESKHSIIVNQAFCRAYGLMEPIGKTILRNKIIGVVNDFHLLSLHNKIEPWVLEISSQGSRQLLVRIRPENIKKTLNFLEKEWTKFVPDKPFCYSFLEDDLDRFYQTEKKLGQIFIAFTVLSGFITCIGLFGLASFLMQQRTKEIGIRKILGASVSGILKLLSGEIVRWVAIANLISWPLAWLAVSSWLQNFAYRIELTFTPFLVAGIVTLILALITVGWQTVRAATANPVEALRYE